MEPLGMNPAQLLIFHEVCSESHCTDPLDLKGTSLGNINLKTEFQRFAKSSWPPDHPGLFFQDLHVVWKSETKLESATTVDLLK